MIIVAIALVTHWFLKYTYFSCQFKYGMEHLGVYLAHGDSAQIQVSSNTV